VRGRDEGRRRLGNNWVRHCPGEGCKKEGISWASVESGARSREADRGSAAQGVGRWHSFAPTGWAVCSSARCGLCQLWSGCITILLGWWRVGWLFLLVMGIRVRMSGEWVEGVGRSNAGIEAGGVAEYMSMRRGFRLLLIWRCIGLSSARILS